MIREAIIRWLKLDERYERKVDVEAMCEMMENTYRSFNVGDGIAGGGSLSPDRSLPVPPR